MSKKKREDPLWKQAGFEPPPKRNWKIPKTLNQMLKKLPFIFEYKNNKWVVERISEGFWEIEKGKAKSLLDAKRKAYKYLKKQHRRFLMMGRFDYR